MTKLSIRLRLTFWYAAVMLAAFAAFGAAMWWALEHRLIAGVDARLALRMQGVSVALGSEAEVRNRAQLQQELAEFANQNPDGTLVQVVDRAGAAVLPNPRQTPLPRHDPARTVYTAVLGGTAYRILSGSLDTAGDTYTALVAAPLDEVDAVMRELRELLFLLVPAALLLACAGGYWLSRRALRPVDEITSVARSISLRNLASRIPVPRTGDELQRMSETWNQALERLDEAVKRVRQFTADASHELRTPLALIRATAELALRKQRAAEEYREALREIESQAGQMTTLTESMLTIARADAGGYDLPLTGTDLNGVVTDEVRQNLACAAVKGVRLDARTGSAPCVVQANAAGLHQLLRILIDNAIRHTPAGGTVTVSAAWREGAAVLAVEDTGEGIAAADLPYIFDRFYRADQARCSGSGFGLGLAIAQAIAQAHNTRIAVTSSPGTGARFAVELAG